MAEPAILYSTCDEGEMNCASIYFTMMSVRVWCSIVIIISFWAVLLYKLHGGCDIEAHTPFRQNKVDDICYQLMGKVADLKGFSRLNYPSMRCSKGQHARFTVRFLLKGGVDWGSGRTIIISFVLCSHQN